MPDESRPTQLENAVKAHIRRAKDRNSLFQLKAIKQVRGGGGKPAAP